MSTAKIIRHRHTFNHYINDSLVETERFDDYKIIFSDPAEMKRFQIWLKKYKGVYEWDDEAKEVAEGSKLPDLEGLGCWCAVFAFYMDIHGWQYHSSLNPYKGEVYTKK